VAGGWYWYWYKYKHLNLKGRLPVLGVRFGSGGPQSSRSLSTAALPLYTVYTIRHYHALFYVLGPSGFWVLSTSVDYQATSYQLSQLRPASLRLAATIR
jgi:hypothetical protein